MWKRGIWKHGQSNGIEKTGYNAYRFVVSKQNPIVSETNLNTVTPVIIELLEKTYEDVYAIIKSVNVVILEKEDFEKINRLKKVLDLLTKAQ